MNHFSVIFYFSILMLFSSIAASAQDTIVKRSNEIVLCKVVEVGDTEINFKRQNNLNGPIYVIQINDVALIKYGSGAKDIFNTQETSKQTQQNQAFKETVKQAPQQPVEQVPIQKQPEQQIEQQKTDETPPGEQLQVEVPEVKPQMQNLYLQGQIDSKKYYKKYKAAGITTMISTIMAPLEFGFVLGPIKAVVVTALCLSKAPKINNLGIPRSSYMNDPQYLRGYKNGAYKKKRKKVLKNFLIPAAAWLSVIILIAT